MRCFIPLSLCTPVRSFSSVPPSPSPPPQPLSPPRSTAASKDERVLTIPNAMTVLRLLISPWLGYEILVGDFALAGGLFLGASFLDVADGWVARRFDQESKLGSYLDPLADKVMVVCAAVPLGLVGALPPALVALWAARDCAIVCGGLYLRAATRPPGVPFFHMTHSSVPTVEPTTISKANTLLQATLAAGALLGLAAGDLGGAAAPALEALVPSGAFSAACGLSAAATLVSWTDYMWKQYWGLKDWRKRHGQ